MDRKIIRAFTDDQAAELTDLPVNRLQRWDRTGFFEPSLAAENRRDAFSRVYSFSDLIALQVLKKLRVDMKCSLQHLREVKGKLAELDDADWANTTLHVLNKKVVFYDERTEEFYEPVSQQKVLKIPLKVVQSSLQERIKELWARDPSSFGRVSKTKRVAQSAEVFEGTRVPVESIYDFIDAGYTDEGILSEFPTLSLEDVKSARFRHAA